MVEILSADAPFAGLVSELATELLAPGQVNRSQNFRHDTGQATARNGTALYLAAPESSMTLVDLIPVELNGTSYLLGFFLKSGVTRIYMSSLGSAWAEITEVGGFSGGSDGSTRFATNTGRFTVATVKAPQGYAGGSLLPSRDVAVISNGSDDVRIWDPGKSASITLTVSNVTNNAGTIRVTFSGSHSLNTGDTVVISGVLGVTAANGSWTVTRISSTAIDLQGSTFSGTYTSGGTALQTLRLTVHKKVIVPDDASTYTQKATFANYWSLVSGTKTYYSSAGPPIINDTSGTNQFDLSSATGVGSSTAASPLIVWGWGTAVATDQIATVYRPAQSLQLGKGLVLGTEDILATFGADFFFSNVKIEVNPVDAVYNDGSVTGAWVTLFDPSSTDDRLRRYDVVEIANEATSELPRKQWFFPADHLDAADKLIFHIRFTKLANAPAPASLAQIVFLYICGAGDFPGGSEFQISYEDEPGRSESATYVPNNSLAASLKDVGGPQTVNSATGLFTIPISGGTFYDYDLVIRNSDAASEIEGGLNGEPSKVNIYVRCPDGDGLEPRALYMYSINVYAPGAFAVPFIGLGWLKSSSGAAIHHSTSSLTDTYGIDWRFRQIDRFAPSSFQICIPPHYASLAKNGRLFVGNVKDESGTQQRGDGYFSGWSQPFRFQALTESAETGGRFTSDGETIQAFVSSAAGNEGVSHIHVLTNKWLYPLGGSGSVGANPLDATLLGVLMPAVGRGTNAPRSVCEQDGAIFYLDNQGQYVRIQNGVTEISRLRVGDKPAQVPNGRLDDICACFFKDRMYSPYTLTGGTTNTKVLGWHDRMKVWEFDDSPPVDVERICVYYDSTAVGSGLRLLVGTQGGIVYEYESGLYDLSTNPIACRLTFGDFKSPEADHPIQIESVDIDADAQSQTWTVDRILGSPSGTYRTQVSLADGWVTDSNLDHTKVAQVAGNEDEWSRTARLDMYGNLTAATRIKKISANVIMSSSRYAKANA